MSLGRLLFSFKGRIGRAQYWVASLFVGGLLVVIGLLFEHYVPGGYVPASSAHAPGTAETVIPLAAFPLIWSLLAIGAKRCHDRGKPGWFQVVGIVPIVGWLWQIVELGFLPGIEETNNYGPPLVPRPPT